MWLLGTPWLPLPLGSRPRAWGPPQEGLHLHGNPSRVPAVVKSHAGMHVWGLMLLSYSCRLQIVFLHMYVYVRTCVCRCTHIHAHIADTHVHMELQITLFSKVNVSITIWQLRNQSSTIFRNISKLTLTMGQNRMRALGSLTPSLSFSHDPKGPWLPG